MGFGQSNLQVGPEVELVLQHYVKQGLATVLPWQLPLKSQVKVRTEAQFTALNDCNLRLVRVAKYAVMVVSSVVSTGGISLMF